MWRRSVLGCWVILLVAIAYVLLADRKTGRGGRSARPERLVLGAAAVLRDL